MAMTPEGKVKAQIDKLLKAHDVWYFKPVSNGMGALGIPDYICCLPGGKFLAIEAKADASKKPTALQQLRMDQIQEQGGVTKVIHAGNLDELNEYLLSHAGGKFLAIEAKADTSKKPTALQQLRMDQIQEQGGVAMVTHAGNLDELSGYLLSHAGGSAWR